MKDNEEKPVYIEGVLIGYVLKLQEADYTIAGINSKVWSGKWEDEEEATNYLIERYNIVKWET